MITHINDWYRMKLEKTPPATIDKRESKLPKSVLETRHYQIHLKPII